LIQVRCKADSFDGLNYSHYGKSATKIIVQVFYLASAVNCFYIFLFLSSYDLYLSIVPSYYGKYASFCS